MSMKAMKHNSEHDTKQAHGRKAALATQIGQLERKILKAVPYDNWSAGDGSVMPKTKRHSD